MQQSQKEIYIHLELNHHIITIISYPIRLNEQTNHTDGDAMSICMRVCVYFELE